MGIIQRETQICLDDVDRSEIDEVRVESRGWAAIRDSLDFMKVCFPSPRVFAIHVHFLVSRLELKA